MGKIRVGALLKGGAVTAVGRCISGGSAIIVSAAAAQNLSKQEFSYYYLLFSFAAFLALVFDGGARQALLRFSALAYRHTLASTPLSLLRLGLTRIAIATLLFLGLASGAAQLMNPERMPLSSSGAIGAAIWGLGMALLAAGADVLRARQNYFLSTLYSNFVPSIIQLCCLAYFLLCLETMNLSRFIAIAISGTICGALIVLIHAYSQIRGCGTRIEIAERRQFHAMANASLPSAIFSFLLVNIDYWIVTKNCAPDDAALYAVAIRLLILVQLPLQFLNLVVAPHVSNRDGKLDSREIESKLRAMTTLAAVPSLILLAIYILKGEFIISAIYGEDYVESWPMLATLAIGQFFNVMTGSCGLLLAMSGYANVLRNYLAISALGLFALCVVLTDMLGAMGAAISSSLALILLNLLTLRKAHQLLGIWTHLSLASVVEMIKTRNG
jgi:O-antigen/teichoic acid export membrane protein